MTRNEQALITMVSSTIVEYFNEYCAASGTAPVKKFSDKKTAVRRTAAVLDAAGMLFDDFCQLRPVEQVVAEINGDALINEDGELDEEPVGATTLAPGGFEGTSATVAPVPSTPVEIEKPKRKSSKGDEQISVVGGKDAANPYREGTKSHAAFKLIQDNPGITRAEFKAQGGRGRTLSHGLMVGQFRVLS